MISGLVLKYLNEECFVIRRGYETALQDSSSVYLTVPALDRPGSDVITDQPGGDKEAYGTTLAVANGMKIGIHTAFSPADQTSTPPFLTPILVVLRCAFK